MNHAHGLDRVAAVSAQALLDLRRVGTLAPVARDEVDGEPEPLRELPPQRCEMARLGHQHAVAGRQGVHQRGLPRAGAAGGIDDDVLPGLEYALQPRQHRLGELRELRTAMIDRRMVDRAQHPVRNIGRARDLEEVSAGRVTVEFEHRGSAVIRTSGGSGAS